MLGADSLEVFKRLGHVRFPGAPDGIRLLGARPRAPQGGPGRVVRPSGLPRWAHCITLYITGPSGAAPPHLPGPGPPRVPPGSGGGGSAGTGAGTGAAARGRCWC